MGLSTAFGLLMSHHSACGRTDPASHCMSTHFCSKHKPSNASAQDCFEHKTSESMSRQDHFKECMQIACCSFGDQNGSTVAGACLKKNLVLPSAGAPDRDRGCCTAEQFEQTPEAGKPTSKTIFISNPQKSKFTCGGRPWCGLARSCHAAHASSSRPPRQIRRQSLRFEHIGTENTETLANLSCALQALSTVLTL